jgi:uncharacterized membrane protein
VDVDARFYLAVLAMGLAAFACRIAGFVLMGWINITPRLEAALRAMPLAVMIGIVTPAVAPGKPPEIAAVLVVGLIVKVTGNEVLAAVAGAAVVAGGRYLMR